MWGKGFFACILGACSLCRCYKSHAITFNLNRLNLVNAGVLKINNIPLRSKKYYKDSIGSGIDHLLMKALQKEFTGECTRADIEFSEPLDL